MRKWLSEPLAKTDNIDITRPEASARRDFGCFVGFGEPSANSSEEVYELAERAAIVEHDAGVPREWAEGFARLDRSTPPRGFSQQRWAQLIDDGGKFLDRWGSKAAALGWDVPSVFGADPRAPGWRLDNAGLVVLINGAAVTAISTETAILRFATGATQSYRRQAMPGAVPLWVLER